MGRRRPAWELQRQADAAERRETFYRNYQGPAPDTTVNSRGPSTELYYRSLVQVSGVERIIYKVNVPNETLLLIPATDAGLLTTLGGTDVALRLRGSGVKPTRLHWYRGRQNPTYVTSRYGSRYVRAYDQGSHASIPLSQPTGDYDADDINDRFLVMFGNGGTRRALLGPANGRAYVELERAPISATS